MRKSKTIKTQDKIIQQLIENNIQKDKLIKYKDSIIEKLVKLYLKEK